VLDVIRKGQRWLTAIFIAVIGLVFVFLIGLGGPMRGGPSAGDVVTLDDIRFGQREFLRIRAQQEEAYRLQLGEQFDPRAAREMLDTMAVGSLVQRAILAHEAERLGLRVGKTEIQRILRDSPSFRDENGKFDNEAFSRYVEWEYGSQRNYLEHMRRLLLTQKMASLLLSQGQLSEAELRASVLYDLEQVRLAYVALETEALSPDVELTDQQIDDYLNSHEAEILALYEERQEDYHVPAQGKVRHILFAVDREAEESQVEAARERAEEALARLHANEEFEVLARELSDDPTSKDQGGDLGFVSPGELAGELEEVTVSLEPGVTSEIVRSDQGFHIVRVDERHESRTRTLDEVERELAREGAEMRAARDRANDLSAKLAQAIRDGKTLEEAARDEEVILERTALLRRRADSFVPGLGSAPELLAAAFAMAEGQSSPRVFPVGSRLALVQLIERKEPEPELLESTISTRRDRFQAAKSDATLRTWIELRRQELERDGRLFVDTDLIAGS